MGGGGVGGGGGGRASWESRDKWDPQIKWDELLGEVSFTHARSSRLAASAGDKGLEDKSRRKPWISRPIFSPLKMSFVQYYCICSPAYFVLLLARALRLRAHQSPSPSCLDPVNCIWRRSLLCTSFAPKHAQPDETSLLFRKTTKSSRRRRRRRRRRSGFRFVPVPSSSLPPLHFCVSPFSCQSPLSPSALTTL